MRAAFHPLAAALLVALALPALPAEAADRDARLAQIRAAMTVQRRHAANLMAHSDVVGTGTGLDEDGRPVIRVLTARPGVSNLPARLEGVAVRLRVTGRIYALRGATCEASGDSICQTVERWPLPVPIGVSIGHPAITAGTIGARVTDGEDVYALSNNHVLANSNLASQGDAVIQPGTFDGGSLGAGDDIATLFDFEPIAFCEIPFFFCSQSNLFDAALALTSPGELGFATPGGEFGSTPGYGTPNPQIHPAYGNPAVLGDEDLSQLQLLAVQKHGRTTGPTSGVIDTIGLTADVCYDELCSLMARFTDQLGIPGVFSAGGDSGSLVVTDDGNRHPVGLLFAGSETQTIVSRIDLVLDRFGVTIDDGGSTGPVTDASLESLTPPSFAIVNETSSIPVVVRNRGTEPLAAFDVIFSDETETTNTVLTAPALDPGVQVQLDLDWTPTQTGPHTLSAALQLADDDPGNNQAAAQAAVLLEPPGMSLRFWNGIAHTDAWTPVALDLDYGSDMVVVCTPHYDATGLGPLVARVRNASGNGFEVGLGRPWFGAFPGEETSEYVGCTVVRAGVYDEPGGARLEAVRVENFAPKDHSGSWVGQGRAYGQAYLQPVVVGQVISPSGGGLPGEIGVWSTFWARGATSLDPPSATQLFVGRHTGEDFTARAPETLAYIVAEAGTGTIEGAVYVAGVGAETVRGVDDAPPYAYPLGSTLGLTWVAAASSAGMDGLEGGWPIFYGDNAVLPSQLNLAIEEDWFFDSERSHTTEQVAYLVFGRAPSAGCGIGFELVLILPALMGLHRRRGRRVPPPHTS
jgi:hypothetical protein